MSTGTATDERFGPPSLSLAVVGYAVFWGYLVVRWVATWTGFDDPFFPSAPFEAAAGSLRATGEAIGLPVVGGLITWFGAIADFLALGTASLPALADGAWLTIVLTVVSILLGLPIAIALAVGRLYGGRFTRAVALGYTELIRGTPLLAQLFVVYFGLNLSQFFRGVSDVGILPRTAVYVAIIGFTINSAAYQGEYIRSALASVDDGQLTAARAVGLPKGAAIRRVVLPQGLRYAIPGWSNELVYLIKYSSLATFITVTELFTRADTIANDTFRYVDMFALVALFYLALVLSATALMRWVEATVAIPGVGGSRR